MENSVNKQCKKDDTVQSSIAISETTIGLSHKSRCWKSVITLHVIYKCNNVACYLDYKTLIILTSSLWFPYYYLMCNWKSDSISKHQMPTYKSLIFQHNSKLSQYSHFPLKLLPRLITSTSLPNIYVEIPGQNL